MTTPSFPPKNISNDLETGLSWWQIWAQAPVSQKLGMVGGLVKAGGWKTVFFVGLIGIGFSAIAGGTWWLWQSSARVNIISDSQQQTFGVDSNLRYQDSSPSAREVETGNPGAIIFVDIAGAVNHPGIYQLAKGDRVANLVEKAGGFSKSADLSYLSQELNLAQVLTDGEKVYVLSRQEVLAKKTQDLASNSQSSDDSNSKSSDGAGALVSLNHATQQQLESLAGIGEKRAADIVAARPFKTIDELLSKKLVSENILAEIKPLLTL